ncbi:MAG TPA: FAD-dependent oxidoreductase [Kineosporiaceae bacterium]
MTARVTVVGAGVVGLSCAVRLAESGLEVDVLARELPPETASAVAGALWLPYLEEPMHEAALWARDTLTELRRLAGAADRPAPGQDTGVRIMPGTLLAERLVPQPAWARRLGDDVRLTAVGNPAPGYEFGYRTELPVIDMRRYLNHLVARLDAAGGTLTRMPLAALPTRGVVVNCTGVAARALAPDPDLRPVRGQTVLVSDPGLTQWWCDDSPERLTYVLPRGRDVVIGGTLEDGDWDPTPDPETGRQLLDRARRLVPELRDARVLGHRVGLRPTRPVIRVEVEVRPNSDDPRHVRVHCYGHGGSGVTLSWGSAGAVTDAVQHLLRMRAPVRQG